MDLKQVAQDKINRAVSAIDSVFKTADDEKRPLNAEELAEVARLEGEHEAAKAELAVAAQAEADATAARQRQDARRAEANKPKPRQATFDQPGSHSNTRIEVIPPEKFTSLGEQLQAIANVSMSGNADNRLEWQSVVPHAAVCGAGSTIPSDAGYLIQKDFQTELMSKVYATGEVLPRCRKVEIGPNSDGLVINMIDESSRASGSRWGGVQVYWGAEADAATAKKPKFRQEKWELKELIGLAYVTDRLLADATALESVYSQAFASEFSFMAEDAVFNGTGGGQMAGILTATAVVSVAKETGQGAATLQYENVLKMWSRMYAPSRTNAVWFINQDIEPQMHQMVIPVGTGGLPVYLPPGGLSQSPYATLFGRPVIPTEYNATLGTTGDIVFADLSQYLVIEKGGLQADSSIHVRFANNEKTFRWIYRLDGKPMWNSALTPAKGSATKSPYVKLDARA